MSLIRGGCASWWRLSPGRRCPRSRSLAAISIASPKPTLKCNVGVRWTASARLPLPRSASAEAEQGHIRGALHGVPVAIKDIIDVEGLPTRANSRSRASAPPASNDAEIVLALKAQGAVVLGKVHTTEFAYFDPSPARNPHNLAHTPGGSSSGSAAAVAAGMAPAAVGTQTVASVNRPAAYCGIGAFKPSTRSLSVFGITPLGALLRHAGLLRLERGRRGLRVRGRRTELLPPKPRRAARKVGGVHPRGPTHLRCDPRDQGEVPPGGRIRGGGSQGGAAEVADLLRAAVHKSSAAP